MYLRASDSSRLSCRWLRVTKPLLLIPNAVIANSGTDTPTEMLIGFELPIIAYLLKVLSSLLTFNMN